MISPLLTTYRAMLLRYQYTTGPLYNVTPDDERQSLSHWGMM